MSTDLAGIRIVVPRPRGCAWWAALVDALSDRVQTPPSASALSPDPEATRRTATEVAALRRRLHAYERAETLARSVEAQRFVRGRR